MHSCLGYDADGKRVTKEDAEGFTRFIYQGPDMLALLQERDESDNLVAHYTMGDGLEAMRRGEESRFYHYDWLGSTFELTDAAGAVTDEYLYDAWGNALAASGATPNPHRYVGRERYYQMPEAGLYHVGRRQLDSSVVRFLSVDPIRHGPNWYCYASGNPVAMTDPSGEASKGRIYYILGSVASLDESRDWRARSGRALAVAMMGGAYQYAATILRSCGYETEFLTSGAASDFRKANSDDATVGIITAGHGGCGYRSNSNQIGIWDELAEPYRAAWGAYTAGPNDWQKVRHPDRFILVYPGHCYVYWADGRLVQGNVQLCRSLQAQKMGVSVDKVRIPHLAARNWIRGAYVTGETAPHALRAAWQGSYSWFGCSKRYSSGPMLGDPRGRSGGYDPIAGRNRIDFVK